MAAIPLAVPFAPAALEGIGAAAAAGLAFTLIPVAVGAAGYLAYEVYNYSQQPPPRRSPSPPRRSPSPPPRKVVIIALMKGRVKRNLKEAQKKNPPDVIVPVPSANAWGPMENLTGQMVEMKLKDQHVWCGHFKSGPPPNNRMNETAIDKMKKNPPDVISHRGVPPSGSKAAVAYSAHSRQWILAWHVPLPSSSSSSSSSSSANKIYVEYGPERPIDWNIIEKRLDASSKTSECDGGYAEITDGADARIGAAFWE